MKRRPRRVLATLLLALATAVAGGPPVAAEEGPATPFVQVRTLNDGSLAGSLTHVGDGVAKVLTPSGARELPLGEIVTLRLVSPGRPALAADAPRVRVALVGGEVLIGRLVGSVPDGIVLESPSLGRLELLFDVIRTLAPVPGDAGPCYEPERRDASGDEDVAYLASGDAFAGIVVSGSEAGFVIETSRGRERQVDIADLLFLHVANDPFERADELSIELETVDGARLVAAADLSLAEGHFDVALRSLPKPRRKIDLTRLRALRPNGGAFVYASDLPFESELVPYYPDETNQRPLIEHWWGARVDRRPSGCPLRLDGTTYRHGFAVHARSRIVLELGSAYARFESLFGVDDEVPPGKDHGIVDARVLADGAVVWEAEGVRVGAKPQRIGPLDVSQVGTLVLEVDFGAAQQGWDRGTWADPILHRK